MLQLGTGIVDNRDDIISDLEAEVESLKASLAHEKQAGRDGARAVAALRKQLAPLYQAMQMVFGHIEAIHIEDHGPTGPIVDKLKSAVWESWKSKIPGRTAQVIDALMVHGQMNSQQIGIAIGIHPNNVPPLLTKLKKAGLLIKNGHNYGLKSL